jgi:RNA polymerase sigma-70 factor (ECF subfamily)
VQLNDQQAWVSLQKGSEDAFEMIFKAYYKPLCRYAYTFLNDADEAEEIVQMAFVTMWDKRGQVEIQSSLKSYLYRAVRNTCLNALKHQKVRQEHARFALAGGENSHELVAQQVEAGELEQKIQVALMALPEQCRLIFQLSRFEELKYQEIADQLSLSVKTVENQMGKALRLMREQLKDYLPLFLIWLYMTPN